ncbi:tRNA dihydrouridine synthase DusB [Micrococcales bacterium 31B]|nr:tRNA dihydrouridine synthase DusB [Micrococcales bacterium 31B]
MTITHIDPAAATPAVPTAAPTVAVPTAPPTVAGIAHSGLTVGPHHVDTPVVLAPMAGITNAAFRLLCREFGGLHSAQDGGVFVSEMVTSRALVERTPESMRLIECAPNEFPRSIQLYGVDPVNVRKAVEMLVREDRADHIDLNFGCPVPKVTRRGGGAVLPWKLDWYTAIVEHAVTAGAKGGVPVTVKMRMGIDDDHITYLDAGKRAQEVGAAWVALHARTAAQHYSGTARWEAIRALKEHVTEIPVLGNGDIWTAEDAVRMMAETGCDGVVVGRGCQGRPWLFADLSAIFHGKPDRFAPNLGGVADTLRRHAELLVEHFGDEDKALRDIRKHMAWYFKGYVVGGELRAQFGQVTSLAHLEDLISQLDLDSPYPGADAEGPRGRAGSPKSPAVPENWLNDRDLNDDMRRTLAEAELSVSGG